MYYYISCITILGDIQFVLDAIYSNCCITIYSKFYIYSCIAILVIAVLLYIVMILGDAQFVQDAIVELQRSRHALMSSYIHAYYIKRHMEREMFEELQVGMVTLSTLLQ